MDDSFNTCKSISPVRIPLQVWCGPPPKATAGSPESWRDASHSSSLLIFHQGDYCFLSDCEYRDLRNKRLLLTASPEAYSTTWWHTSLVYEYVLPLVRFKLFFTEDAFRWLRAEFIASAAGSGHASAGTWRQAASARGGQNPSLMTLSAIIKIDLEKLFKFDVKSD